VLRRPIETTGVIGDVGTNTVGLRGVHLFLVLGKRSGCHSNKSPGAHFSA
jgi:hypothetical protein